MTMKTGIATKLLRIFVTAVFVIFVAGLFVDSSLAGGKGQAGTKNAGKSSSAGSCPPSGGDAKAQGNHPNDPLKQIGDGTKKMFDDAGKQVQDAGKKIGDAWNEFGKKVTAPLGSAPAGAVQGIINQGNK
jgi:hypothetical protein